MTVTTIRSIVVSYRKKICSYFKEDDDDDEDEDEDEDEDDDEEDEDGFDHPVYELINRSSPFSTSNKRSIKNKMGKTCIFYQIGQRNRMKELCKSKLARLEAMLV